MTETPWIERYMETLAGKIDMIEATDVSGHPVPIDEAVETMLGMCRYDGDAPDRKFIFIGNGGSASIASHMAIDFSKNGEIWALALNDAAALTCLANDLGFENVFAHQIRMLALWGDVLVAISSSGQSQNILNAVGAARDLSGIKRVITLSGFRPGNSLRGMGDLNFYVPSMEYGFVEVAHLALLHAILDRHMGWKPDA